MAIVLMSFQTRLVQTVLRSFPSQTRTLQLLAIERCEEFGGRLFKTRLKRVENVLRIHRAVPTDIPRTPVFTLFALWHEILVASVFARVFSSVCTTRVRRSCKEETRLCA
jgi:hypothetical protein